MAMADAGVETVDALYAANMLSDELQSQKHIATLLADEAGLAGIEALQVRAATASGAAGCAWPIWRWPAAQWIRLSPWAWKR